MSGVVTGSRLDRLHALQRATKLQRALAARQRRPTDQYDALLDAVRREIAREQIAHPAIARAVHDADQRTAERLYQLGVTAHDVKRWAVAAGIIPAVVRGRVALALVQAYAHAHQPQETP